MLSSSGPRFTSGIKLFVNNGRFSIRPKSLTLVDGGFSKQSGPNSILGVNKNGDPNYPNLSDWTRSSTGSKGSSIYDGTGLGPQPLRDDGFTRSGGNLSATVTGVDSGPKSILGGWGHTQTGISGLTSRGWTRGGSGSQYKDLFTSTNGCPKSLTMPSSVDSGPTGMLITVVSGINGGNSTTNLGARPKYFNR